MQFCPAVFRILPSPAAVADQIRSLLLRELGIVAHAHDVVRAVGRGVD